MSTLIDKPYLESIAKGNEYILQSLLSLSKTLFPKLFSTEPNKAYEVGENVNEEYMEFVGVWYKLSQYRVNSEENIASSAAGQQIIKGKQGVDFNFTLELLLAVGDLMERVWKMKEAAFSKLPLEKRPRIMRVTERMKLSTKEQMIFDTIFYNSLNYGGIAVYTMVSQTDVTYSEVAHFLNPNRDHMKQNLFEYADMSRPFQTSLQFSAELTSALLGVPLTDEQLLKLDNTAMSEVINEEQGKKAEDDDDEDRDKDSVKSPSGDKLKKEKAGLDEDAPFGEDVSPPASGEDLPIKEEGEGIEDGEKPTDSDPKEGDDADPEDFHNFLKMQIASEGDLPKPPTVIKADGDDPDKLVPYTSDLDYLETESKRSNIQFQIEQMESQINQSRANVFNYGYSDNHQQEIKLRELKAQLRVQDKKCTKRLAMTVEAGDWLPRMERMVRARSLDKFERNTLLSLVTAYISSEMRALGYRSLSVGTILRAFCSSFAEQIQHRSYFYKGSKLVKEGIIRISGGTSLDGDLMEASVNIDRRMLEFAMGLDTEFSELVEGSHLYYPKVHLEQVVLPDDLKKLILNSVSNFEGFKKAMKRTGFDEAITYGAGIVMLFFGASGTGKTMMANAIANHVNKRILLINFPSLGSMNAGENLKFVFREAKINDAILFFDECESIFESRDLGNHGVNLLLTEIERHDGLIIMATNRAFDLDEAMHRRVTLAIEFNKPDPILREKIWQANIPKDLPLNKDVNLKDLAMSFELTGGFIKNAILSALSIAVSRDGDKEAVVRQEDLESGARLQLRGRLRMIDFEHRFVPQRGLEALILAPAKIKILNEVIGYEKARQILIGQWGFGKMLGQDKANSVLFWGPPGTGKTLAAEAIAFSTGKPLKLINTAELISKYVGETSKNIAEVFKDAAANDAVLVFDEAEALFGTRTATSTATDRYANSDVGLLLYHIENYRGIVILCTNLVKEIDSAFFRRIKFVVEFTIPDATARANLWRTLVPPECPLAKSIDFANLGNKFEFSGGHIKSAVVRAATRAALREESKRIVTQEDLEAAGKEEGEKGDKAASGLSLYV